jgi:hypothetical protein
MSKKDYQAIARAIYGTREMIYRDPHHDEIRDALLRDLSDRLANIMAADSPRFNRARFLEACETGTCKGMRKVGR